MRRWFVLTAVLVTQLWTFVFANEITVYKSPSCGCCKKWVTHLEQNGFIVTSHDVESIVPVKQKHGVLPQLGSCHTGLIDGYVIEGHVPADDIKRLLKEKPAVAGLAVPGMPVGTPGMEQGNRKDSYQVLSFDRSGNIQVFAEYK
ncbi:MAG: DUF411 domain-containing protein [Gammaproteobacteria bacterium]|nr:DUF411 domain-containing protein [Gammaproteobacteria bacterium]